MLMLLHMMIVMLIFYVFFYVITKQIGKFHVTHSEIIMLPI
jgi:hypothetical protein